MSSLLSYCIGIDGGGTKTEGVLTDASGHVLGQKNYGASNPNDVGLDNSAELIVTLISDLLAEGGNIPLEEVSIFAGISGALNRREELAAAIGHRLKNVGSLSVHSDVINLLSSVSPTGEGICLISGTGSVCFARSGNTFLRIGGWGYLLDSGGSGYDVGRMALEAALKAGDGRVDAATHAPLRQALTTHLGCPPEAAITQIYEQGKPYIAACAPVVFDLAQNGDSVSDSILQTNAQALADCIAAALKALESDRPVPVILGGSLCVKGEPYFTEKIQSGLPAHLAPLARLTVADVPPVFGALAEAFGHIFPIDRCRLFGDFRHTFLQTYGGSLT